MLIWTTKFSRKKAVLSVLIMGAVMIALILLTSGRKDVSKEQVLCLNDNTQRVKYLRSFGWEVIPEPLETLQFLLPEVLEEPYLTYNELQKTQGFDLSACCGKQVSRYTYAVTNHPDRQDGVQANLYVCEEQAVAGDIFCAGENGFQTGLQYPRTEE